MGKNNLEGCEYMLSIKKDEVLRYLNYKGQEIDRTIDDLIDEAIKEIKDIIIPKSISKEFKISRRGKDIELGASELSLKGESIWKHLRDSDKCILIAFTLDHELDRRIRYYEKTNMTKAIILDACASTAIEEFADNVCSSLEAGYIEKGQKFTSRFSPGYGDLDISIQEAFLNLLDARKTIGLTATSHSILIPRKSVTAIIGIIHKDTIDKERACKDCNKYKNCKYARGDDGCGN